MFLQKKYLNPTYYNSLYLYQKDILGYTNTKRMYQYDHILGYIDTFLV